MRTDIVARRLPAPLYPTISVGLLLFAWDQAVR